MARVNRAFRDAIKASREQRKKMRILDKVLISPSFVSASCQVPQADWRIASFIMPFSGKLTKVLIHVGASSLEKVEMRVVGVQYVSGVKDTVEFTVPIGVGFSTVDSDVELDEGCLVSVYATPKEKVPARQTPGTAVSLPPTLTDVTISIVLVKTPSREDVKKVDLGEVDNV